MGHYQKLGVFVSRALAGYYVTCGLLGFLHEVVARIQALPGDSYHLASSFVWTAGGLVMFACSRILGRWMAEGLDAEKVAKPLEDMD